MAIQITSVARLAALFLLLGCAMVNAAAINVGPVSFYLGQGKNNGTGVGSDPSFNGPSACVVDTAGNLYFVETENHVVRRVLNASSVQANVFVGSIGNPGITLSTGGTSARLASPFGMTFAADGTNSTFIADFGKNRILRLALDTAAVTLVAGNADGLPQFNANGFNGPSGVAQVAGGALIVVEKASNRVRRVESGAITVLSGPTGGAASLTVAGDASGASVAAADVRYNAPTGVVAYDAAGAVFVADTLNQRIKMVYVVASGGFAVGQAVVVAGNGTAGNRDGALGVDAQFVEPWHMVIREGFLYIADRGNNAVKRMSLAAGNAVDTVVGNYENGWTSSSASSVAARVASPRGVCFAPAMVQPRLYVIGDHSLSYVSLRAPVAGTITPGSGDGSATPNGNGTSTRAPGTPGGSGSEGSTGSGSGNGNGNGSGNGSGNSSNTGGSSTVAPSTTRSPDDNGAAAGPAAVIAVVAAAAALGLAAL